jgi:succinate dehydrogenase / fumarate reductase flavoprotein subunit
MTEYAGEVRDESSLRAGLAALDAIEGRIIEVGVDPDIASYHDLAHAFDLRASALAARATFEAALARRETRGCHNRADHPRLDPDYQVNFVWSGPGRLDREAVAAIPADIAALMKEVSGDGKLLE